MVRPFVPGSDNAAVSNSSNGYVILIVEVGIALRRDGFDKDDLFRPTVLEGLFVSVLADRCFGSCLRVFLGFGAEGDLVLLDDAQPDAVTLQDIPCRCGVARFQVACARGISRRTLDRLSAGMIPLSAKSCEPGGPQDLTPRVSHRERMSVKRERFVMAGFGMTGPSVPLCAIPELHTD
jgi:hypothetical protein